MRLSRGSATRRRAAHSLCRRTTRRLQRAQDTLPAAEIFWEQLTRLQTATERVKEALERDEGLALLMPTDAHLLTRLREELDTLRDALQADFEACENNGKRLQTALDDPAERQQIASQLKSVRARLEQNNRLLEARTDLFDEQTIGLDTFSSRLFATSSSQSAPSLSIGTAPRALSWWAASRSRSCASGSSGSRRSKRARGAGQEATRAEGDRRAP